MKKRFKKWLFFLVGLLFFSLGDILVEGAVTDNAAGFTHQIVYPDNQLNENGYFNLKMNPGQTQSVQIKLKNLSNDDATVAVSLNDAMTNPNGIIEYGISDLESDPSMRFSFTDIVTAPKQLTIPANAEIPLLIEVSMPDSVFDGIILGGIHLQRLLNEEAQIESKGTMVLNEYAYVIGMQLSETEVSVNSDMGFIKAYASQPDFRNTISIDLGNKSSSILSNLTIDSQIMSEKSDTVLYEARQTNMRMAPNSIINFPISMDGQEMKPGKYRARVLATSGDQKWEWLEPFTITKKEADNFNQKAVGLIQSRGVNWMLIALIVTAISILFVIMGIIMFWVNKRTRRSMKKKKRVIR